MSEEIFCHINIGTIPAPVPPSHSPTVPPSYTLQQFCEQGRQRHLRLTILLMISNRRRPTCAYGRFTSTGDAVKAVDPPSDIIYVIASALQCKTLPRDSLLVNPPLPMGTVKREPSYVETWPSTPNHLVQGSYAYLQQLFEAVPDRIPCPQWTSGTIPHG